MGHARPEKKKTRPGWWGLKMASLPSNCGSPPTTARAGVPSPAPCGNADESDEDHSGVGPKGMAIGGLAGVGSLRGLCSPLCVLARDIAPPLVSYTPVGRTRPFALFLYYFR